MQIKTIRTRIFSPNENLVKFIDKYIKNLKEESIIVVTSKIVALAEGRFTEYIDHEAKLRVIKDESDVLLPGKYVLMTIKDGEPMSNAGIDESNADNLLILLPRDSFKSASVIRKYFKTKYKLKNLGVIVTDSRSAPLRFGAKGISLGYAGVRGLKKYRGKPDIFGRPFKYSRVNAVDSLAAAAVLVMGEGNEQQPLAIISKAPVFFANRVDRKELKIDINEDIYGDVFRKKLVK